MKQANSGRWTSNESQPSAAADEPAVHEHPRERDRLFCAGGGSFYPAAQYPLLLAGPEYHLGERGFAFARREIYAHRADRRRPDPRSPAAGVWMPTFDCRRVLVERAARWCESKRSAAVALAGSSRCAASPRRKARPPAHSGGRGARARERLARSAMRSCPNRMPRPLTVNPSAATLAVPLNEAARLTVDARSRRTS